MEITSYDPAPIISSYNTSSVLCLVEYDGISHSVRLPLDTTLAALKSYFFGWYGALRSNVFNILAFRGDVSTAIDSDMILQSVLALHFVLKEEFAVFKVMINGSGSTSSGHESVSVISASSTSSSGVYNEKGMECFTSGQASPILREVGQVFADVYDFRIQLMKNCLKTGYQVKLTKNNSDKVSAVCKLKDKMDCKWRVYASLQFPGAVTFSIKTFECVHTCGAAFVDVEKFKISSKLVKSVIVDLVRENPLMTPQDVISYFRREYKYNINYYFGHAGLGLALKDVNGDHALSYHELEDYLVELDRSNPGSHIKLEKDSVTRQFKRVFVSFGACINGFRFCRPFIALDGTFLKNKYKGCLMAATGINGNQGFFQLAFAIVAGEDTDNWNWFMNELKVVIGMERRYTFISDRHPGLLVAVPESFPSSYHSHCLYHLGLNLSTNLGRSSKKKKASISALEQVCHSATLAEYNANLKRFSGIAGPNGMTFLNTLSADKYVDFCFPGSRYGYVCSTIAESYNRWILQERHLPIKAMVDKIRQKTMKMFSDRRDAAAKWTTRLCPLKEKLLSKRLEDGASWIGFKVCDLKWEILDEVSYIVNLVDRSCTCNKWKIEGFPCAHSLRAMKLERCDVYSYVDEFLFTSCFRECYAGSIEPIINSGTLVDPPKELSVLPPVCRRQPGRPRNKRIPNTGSVLKRKNVCTNCHEASRHNKRTCTAPPA